MKDFVHLHVHTEYSLLDGVCRIDRMMERLREMGQTAVAITDHGVMYGVVDFYKAAKAAGIKPIIGCEVYTAPRTRFDKEYEHDSDIGHLVLLAKDDTGYRNLLKIVSAGFTDGFYIKPRIDTQLLEKHSEGLVALSACLSGDVPKKLLRGDYEGAKKLAMWYKRVFGEDYYIELQDHGLDDQREIAPKLISLAKELSIKPVVTNDAHYIEKKDAQNQRVLMCIQMAKTISDESKMGFDTQEFYLKDGDAMAALFPDEPQAVLSTLEIAEKCNVDFEFGKIHLPEFHPPKGRSSHDYLMEQCDEGLRRRYGENPPDEHRERLLYELETIKTMGYEDYFLIVGDFISYARGRGIAVGPGRGSAAGSIVAYCLGITDIDPMEYQLLFERFLNPERISMPDIDIDFCYERRQEVIDYVVQKYGSDRVAQIVTFGTMAARAAIRDVGRALGMTYADVDAVAKMVPFEIKMTLDRALQTAPQLKELYGRDQNVKTLIDTARELEGLPRHASTHAAGVVITKEPVHHYVPLSKNEDAVVTQFPMGTLEELGLLKMDFLGLRTLTVIRSAEEMIRRREPDFDIERVSLRDPAVFEMLGAGQTTGVFQFESAGMRQVLMGLKPEGMEDIIAVISLYRPGPMDSIPKYIESRHNVGKITYKHPKLEPILNRTYGCIVYQEQVMQIARELAGYSYGMADLLRRAMSKKKMDVMQRERETFLYGKKREDGSVECVGAIANGVPKDVANDIFDEMTAFASYAFNKSHAACYAMVAYRTAYLKAHYQKEFMAALLNSVIDSTDRVQEYIGECTKLGIRVSPPDINLSDTGFAVSGEEIRFGLVAIKNIGRSVIAAVLEERGRGGAFRGFYDFISRTHEQLGKKSLEGFIYSGALDTLGLNRRQMIASYAGLLEGLGSDKRRNVEGQVGLFEDEQNDDGFVPPNLPEMPLKEKLALEKAATGLYLSGHPLLEHREDMDRAGAVTIGEVLRSLREGDGRYGDNDMVTLAGVIVGKKLKTTRSGSTMAFITLEDMSASIEGLVFPKTLEQNYAELQVDAVVVLKGRISVKEEEDPKLVLDTVRPIKAGPEPGPEQNGGKQQKLYLRVPCEGSAELERALQITAVFDGGEVPLCIYCKDTGKYKVSRREMWVSPADIMLKHLRTVLGDENVVLK